MIKTVVNLSNLQPKSQNHERRLPRGQRFPFHVSSVRHAVFDSVPQGVEGGKTQYSFLPGPRQYREERPSVVYMVELVEVLYTPSLWRGFDKPGDNIHSSRLIYTFPHKETA